MPPRPRLVERVNLGHPIPAPPPPQEAPKVNVTIQRIEVESADPDEFAANVKKSDAGKK